MSRRPPNKFNRESEHAHYGIWMWFSKFTDIKDIKIQRGLVECFLEDYEFVEPEGVGKKKIKAAKAI